MSNYTADTRVKVNRTVQVSVTATLAELATATGEDVADVVTSFRNGAGNEWVTLYQPPPLVEFLPTVEAGSDVWSVRVVTS